MPFIVDVDIKGNLYANTPYSSFTARKSFVIKGSNLQAIEFDHINSKKKQSVIVTINDFVSCSGFTESQSKEFFIKPISEYLNIFDGLNKLKGAVITFDNGEKIELGDKTKNKTRVISVINPNATISSFLKHNEKSLFGKSGFDYELYQLLQVYEKSYEPLYSDGRKGISYESAKVDGNNSSFFHEELMEKKENAIKKIGVFYKAIDDCYDTVDYSILRSNKFKYLCEGFKEHENAKDVFSSLQKSLRLDDQKSLANMIGNTLYAIYPSFSNAMKKNNNVIRAWNDGELSQNIRDAADAI